uniref:Uncharacterized protein n=1 Tax=Chromera velia CCMP2878 TaxID=1169474 RepID=A0A0G4I4A1_9ALVE|eukprot:Cvel_10873.t1-p1 / transcript=Cvel_10873.t1 / gene=Cvel_10873 / organism=Chromera_velia_CCMP2878 / gene_product=hypothetical protein / transcript_product=hypothetical protein / location=Cvel_scaffold666:32998-34326(+) / protein_length=331 / sequence_SO=supercontig / SO=protein_coding / is_pseudo=false
MAAVDKLGSLEAILPPAPSQKVKAQGRHRSVYVALSTVGVILISFFGLLSTFWIYNVETVPVKSVPESHYLDRGAYMFGTMFFYLSLPLLFTARNLLRQPKCNFLWSNIETTAVQSGILLQYWLSYTLAANGVIDPMADRLVPGRRIHFVRYMGWVVAMTGYAYLIICKLNKRSLGEAFPCLAATAGEILFGFWADIAGSVPLRQFLYVFVWSCFLLSAFGLVSTLPPSRPTDTTAEKVKVGLVRFTCVHWSLYGPVYHMGQYGGIDSTTEQFLFCVLDITYKIAVSACLVAVHSSEWTQMRMQAEHAEMTAWRDQEFQARLQLIRDEFEK